MAPATPAKQPVVKHQIVSLSVDLGVTTPDKLRHVGFGLQKDTHDDGVIAWEIEFTLQERAKASEPFTDIVSLTVKVKSKNNAAAESTATEGLTDGQVTHLSGPAAVAAKKLADGTFTADQTARVVEGTLAKRGA
jgi:hypothetical protein